MKIYNTAYEPQTKSLLMNVNKAVEDKKIVKFGIHRPKRTRKQQGYMEVLFGMTAVFMKDTKQWVKQVLFKEIINPDIFRSEYTNKIMTRVFWRSTADLDTREASICVERLRNYVAENVGEYLPEPHEDLTPYENEIAKYENQVMIGA